MTKYLPAIIFVGIAMMMFLGLPRGPALLKQSPTSTPTPETTPTSDDEVGDIMEAIKRAEAARPPGISESPTVGEVYNNPFIQHIRTALNGYLDGTNNGIEEGTRDIISDPECGLDNYDKDYYRSKFFVFDVKNNEYGGVYANMFFVDKPDLIFWAWVYKYGGNDEDGEYVLRGFCENGPSDEKREEFMEWTKKVIESDEIFYVL